jgi:hypothetical protein
MNADGLSQTFDAVRLLPSSGWGSWFLLSRKRRSHPGLGEERTVGMPLREAQ